MARAAHILSQQLISPASCFLSICAQSWRWRPTTRHPLSSSLTPAAAIAIIAIGIAIPLILRDLRPAFHGSSQVAVHTLLRGRPCDAGNSRPVANSTGLYPSVASHLACLSGPRDGGAGERSPPLEDRGTGKGPRPVHRTGEGRLSSNPASCWPGYPAGAVRGKERRLCYLGCGWW